MTVLAVVDPNTLIGTELRQELRLHRELWSEVRLLSAATIHWCEELSDYTLLQILQQTRDQPDLLQPPPSGGVDDPVVEEGKARLEAEGREDQPRSARLVGLLQLVGDLFEPSETKHQFGLLSRLTEAYINAASNTIKLSREFEKEAASE